MHDISELERQLKILANKRRLHILSHLKCNKAATVGEIADAVGVTVRGASQHLRLLRNAKIVKNVKRGLYVSYRLQLPQKEPVQKILSAL